MARWQREICTERRKNAVFIWELSARKQLDIVELLDFVGLDAWDVIGETNGKLSEIEYVLIAELFFSNELNEWTEYNPLIMFEKFLNIWK